MANFRRKKVVYIEANESCDISKLKKNIPFLKDTIGEEDFVFQNIYFVGGNAHLIPFGLLDEADYVIKDFGVLEDDIPDEFLIADKKILIGNLCAWKRDKFAHILKPLNINEKGGWVMLAQSAYLDDVKKLYKETGFLVHPMPYISNPFQLKRQELKELEDFA